MIYLFESEANFSGKSIISSIVESDNLSSTKSTENRGFPESSNVMTGLNPFTNDAILRTALSILLCLEIIALE